MSRFVWAAWGLLVVVLDLPLFGWDVLPDIVGYLWLVVGLGGATHMAFARARAAAAAGVPVALVTGTPLFVGQDGIIWGAVFIEILLTVLILHQLATAISDLAPDGDQDARRWARGIRIGAPAAGVIRLIGLVGLATSLGALYALGYLGLVAVGIVTVVLMHRVNRSGWLDLAPPDPA
jgi:hypothetical protein